MLLRIKKIIDNAFMVYLGLIMFSMAAVVFMQVIARYIFMNAFSWPGEMVRVGVVWTTFLGSYIAIVKKKEIRFGALVNKLSEKWRLILGVVGEVIAIFFLVVVVWQGWIFVVKFAKYKLPMTGFSRAIIYSVFPLGGFFMLVHAVITLVDLMKKLIKQEDK